MRSPARAPSCSAWAALSPDDGMLAEVENAIASGAGNVSWNGTDYRVVESEGQYYLCTVGEPRTPSWPLP